MQKNPHYDDLMTEIAVFLHRSCEKALAAGVEKEQIVIDPGIGFGKGENDNFQIINRLAELTSMGYPLLMGVSRKSFIGKTLHVPEEERLAGSLAAHLLSGLNGAAILRTHDVRETREAVEIAGRTGEQVWI